MPELPEVEASRKLLETYALGHTVIKIITVEQGGGPRDSLFDDKIFCNSNEDQFTNSLLQRTISKVYRKGKYLWFELISSSSSSSSSSTSILNIKSCSKSQKKKTSSSQLIPMFHFGMTGTFLVKGVKAPVYRDTKHYDTNWPPRFCKCEFILSNGVRIAFVNSRRFGRISLVENPLTEGPVSKLGWDVLNDLIELDEKIDENKSEFNATTRTTTTAAAATPSTTHSSSISVITNIKSLISAKRSSIKAILLDQKILTGVGNWIADEILYHSKVHPESTGDSLSNEQLDSILLAARNVVMTAVKCNAESNQFPEWWMFHVRWNKGKNTKVKTFRGESVVFKTVGSRTSAFCPSIQRKGTRNSKQGGTKLTTIATSTNGKKKEGTSSNATRRVDKNNNNNCSKGKGKILEEKQKSKKRIISLSLDKNNIILTKRARRTATSTSTSISSKY